MGLLQMDYTKMNTFLQCDWNDILQGKNAGQQFDIFTTKFNEAENKYIPHMNTKATTKLRNTAIFLWILKPYRRLKRNLDVGLDTEKLGDKKGIRNTPKQEIKLKAQSGKQKLIWRKKLQKMLRYLYICYFFLSHEALDHNITLYLFMSCQFLLQL